MECPVHDKWQFNKDCTCNSERQWTRKKMLQESLEILAKPRTKATLLKGEKDEK